MKQTLILLAAATALSACSAQDADGDAMMAADTEMAAEVLADLGGEPQGPIFTKTANDTLALSGYDAVSYFTEEAPLEGSAAFAVRYEGYDYQFANAENAATFQADPAKYAPQYGGYCAWALGANDALASTDPNVYKIVDGKLYLNNSPKVAEMWEEDIPGFIESADANYTTHPADEHYTTN